MRRSSYAGWANVFIAAAILFSMAACGGGDESPTPTMVPALPPEATATPMPPEDTPTPEPPTPTSAPAEQPESPLEQPESPLAQPESPLASPASQAGAEAAAPTIDMSVPIDPGFFAELVETTVSDDPSPGTASISGVLYSYNIDNVIPGTQFYLTAADEYEGKATVPVVFLGPRPEEGDLLGFSNEMGQVSMTDIPPGNYYMAVWTVYDWLLPTAAEDDTRPVLIALEPDQKLDLGALYLNWP